MQPTFFIRNLIYFISITSNLVLGFFVFLKERKGKINRTFFFTVSFANLWLISLFLFHTLEEPRWILWVGRFNFAVILPMLYYLLRFVVIFPREIVFLPKKFEIGLRSWLFLFTILTFLTPLISKEEIIIGAGQRETIYGPLYSLYVFHYIAFSLIVTIILYRKMREIKEEVEKNQIRYVLIGLSLALSFGFITNILFYSLGMVEMANFGPLATLIFFGFVTAAITRYHLFGIQVILTEILVFVIGILILIQIFVAPTVLWKIVNGIIFLLFCIFGYLLIRGVFREIKRREELERISRAKTEFISITSHQLRTPLTVIKGYLSMILEGVYGEVSEKVKKVLESVYLANERLIKLVNSFLSVSKIELGKLELELEKADIAEIIESVVKEMEIEAKEKNIYLRFEKPKEAPKTLIDKEKIREVILNLVDNAIKYTQRGGIDIRLKILNDKLQIVVSDTGEGLTKEEKEKLFESFSRGTAGEKYWVEGVGVGLYIARKIVELHQGKIWADSEGKEKGSKFFVELPIKNNK